MNNPPPKPLVTDVNRPMYAAAARGEFLLQRCVKCGRFIYYPRVACPYCLADEVEWVVASGRGTIYSFTIVEHPAHPAFSDKVPIVLAAVQLDEGPMMVASVQCEPSAIRIGERVQMIYDLEVDGLVIPRFALGTR
jgi:uncharacterized OB-fold protein